MKRKIIFILFFVFLLPSRFSFADREPHGNVNYRPIGFPTGNEVQARIDFWKLIFTKYGENQLVFHHRQYPEIIYSVLDLTEYVDSYKGWELETFSNQAIKEEYQRIKALLKDLASGKDPENPTERRLYSLFSKIPGNISSNLKAATEDDNLRYQRGIKERFEQGLIRSGRYLPEMEKIFSANSLPIELTRIPLIESSFDYTAYSSVGAAGIWQFMRSTAKKTMRMNSLVDERRDPLIATRAAADYLAHAYEVLGSWSLAVTSYNHGINGVLKASKAVGSKDINKIIREYDSETFGFASKNFYPEFMAALEIEQNIQRYFPGLQKERQVSFEELRLPNSISFKNFVNLSGINEQEALALNTHLMKPVTSNKQLIPAGTLVKVPVARTANFYKKGVKPAVVASGKQKKDELKIVAEGKSERFYIVQMGDNLNKISKKMKISISQLRKLNPQLSISLKAGDKLKL